MQPAFTSSAVLNNSATVTLEVFLFFVYLILHLSSEIHNFYCSKLG